MTPGEELIVNIETLRLKLVEQMEDLENWAEEMHRMSLNTELVEE